MTLTTGQALADEPAIESPSQVGPDATNPNAISEGMINEDLPRSINRMVGFAG